MPILPISGRDVIIRARMPCADIAAHNRRSDEMSKEQKSNREKKKPKQDKSAKTASSGTAYAQAKAASKK